MRDSAVACTQPNADPICTQRELTVLALIVFIALLKIRKMLWWVSSNDTRMYFEPWLTFIHSHGGWHALRYPFAEYFPAYLYFMAGVSYLDRWISPLAQIKVIPAVFDVVAAVFAYRIIGLLGLSDRHPAASRTLPLVASLVVLALPSLLLDGALWGQCDSIYLSFLLATMYYLIRSAPLRSSVCFGLAMCFKFQAVFLAPVLIVALLRRRYAWWHPLLVPAIWAAVTVPAVLMGRSFRSIIGLFAMQSRLFPDVAMNVANPYQYFYALHISNALGVRVGMLATAISFGALVCVGLRRKVLDPCWLFFFATCSLVVMPYVMPKMHDRYFLPAQVFLVILACFRPRFVVPAVLLEIALLLPYLNYFHDWRRLDGMKVALVASTAAVLVLLRDLWRGRESV